MTTIYLAEKPSVAGNIAKALNCARKDGYFEGEGNIVTYAFGHLLELKDCVDYDPSMSTWQLDKFPFIPERYEYKVKTDIKTKKTDTGVLKQLNTIKALVNRSDVTKVVNACDFDREGLVIFTLIINYLKVNKPCFYLDLNEWTPNEVRSGISRMKSLSNLANKQKAGIARQIADFELGVNFTTVSSLKFIKGRGPHPISIGRVVLPTLKMIYDRDMEIKNFIPEDYFEIKATFNTNKGNYTGLLLNKDNETRYRTLRDIQLITKEIEKKDAVIIDKKVTQNKQNAPLLFNLNDLEGYITSKYNGWTSDMVDKVAQTLYEGKGNGGFISYPRTKSRHLEANNEFVDKARKVLDTIKKGLPYEKDIVFHNDKRVFDSSKVDGHGAIIPTYILPTGLTKDEQLVYDEVVKRFIAQFMPAAEYENTEVLTKITNTEVDRLFITKGKILISEGWQKVYGKESQDDVLPPINKGDKAIISSLEELSKQTQPPKHYTEKTLFKAMETCGKKVKSNDDELDNEMLSAVMSGYEIGTPATRSDTVKKMKTVGYIELKGKSLVTTDLGIRLIEAFPVDELKNLDFTGKLEKTLSDIEKGKYTQNEFLNLIHKLTIDGVNRIKQTNTIIVDYGNGSGTGNSSNNSNSAVLGSCPSCGKPVIEGVKGYGCSGWKDGCKFVIWKKNAFLEKFNISSVSLSTAKALLKSPEGVDIKADSTLIKAKLVNSDKGYELKLEVQEGKLSYGKCPECGKEVYANSKAYSCEDRACSFVIWKNDNFLAKYKKKPTEAMVKSLLSNGTASIKGMQSLNKDSKFDCTLNLIKNGIYWNFNILSSTNS